MNNVEAKVKELVTDFKLDEALDMLITQAQTQNQRKQNTLLVLKGKLAMLEEQNLSGMLDLKEVAQQKAVIAHQILDIADGSLLDYVPPTTQPEMAMVKRTVSVPVNGSGLGKYLSFGGLLLIAVVAMVLFTKSPRSSDSSNATNHKNPELSNTTPLAGIAADQTTLATGDSLRLMNFPNLQLPFNFLDFSVDFRWANAEWISDNEIRLKIRYNLTCRSNLGICYRATVRLYADGRPIAPADQSNVDGWVAHDATITDDLAFVLPADTKTFEIELSRDKSTWRRPFKILR